MCGASPGNGRIRSRPASTTGTPSETNSRASSWSRRTITSGSGASSGGCIDSPAVKRHLLVLLLVATAACDIPRDPEGTLQRVAGDVLRAGFTEAPPWASGAVSDPQGVEVELVEGFAETLGARVEWTKAPEAELFKALEVRSLDIVVGGFDASDPWVVTAGMTRPYAKTRLVVGVVGGSSPPRSLEDWRVAAEAGSESEGLLREAGAEVEPVDDVTQARGAVAVEQWMLDDLELADSGHVLGESQHVMAVPLGENAFLVALERHLHERHNDIRRRIDRAGLT
ncbi:MAG: transporter substrate-binding domain-containing protein [Nitriliruptorales bacterium]|nr:transporter substrate-binding domain-containing protein [Nitriliruptorales bacterium]